MKFTFNTQITNFTASALLCLLPFTWLFFLWTFYIHYSDAIVFLITQNKTSFINAPAIWAILEDWDNKAGGFKDKVFLASAQSNKEKKCIS